MPPDYTAHSPPQTLAVRFPSTCSVTSSELRRGEHTNGIISMWRWHSPLSGRAHTPPPSLHLHPLHFLACPVPSPFPKVMISDKQVTYNEVQSHDFNPSPLCLLFSEPFCRSPDRYRQYIYMFIKMVLSAKSPARSVPIPKLYL